MEAATTTLERRVREIPPTKKPEEVLRNYNGKMRVAAYCRVSTDSEEQLNSYEAQKSYYTQKIQDNPDWEMAGIYADEGISGTSLKKRAEFNKMITACKRGRIDFIITKSLSRFARNTVDCLDTVRLLKANGIGVYFEKENINTLTESSEFLVTLFSGFAQAESESLSKNVAWGKEKSAKAGNVHFQYKKMLGYRKGEGGQPEIVPEEAEMPAGPEEVMETWALFCTVILVSEEEVLFMMPAYVAVISSALASMRMLPWELPMPTAPDTAGSPQMVRRDKAESPCPMEMAA